MLLVLELLSGTAVEVGCVLGLMNGLLSGTVGVGWWCWSVVVTKLADAGE